MGAVCAKSHPRKHPPNKPVPDANNAAPVAEESRVYMVIIALDYEGSGYELTCTQDGDNLRELVTNVGVSASNITVLYNNDGNKEQVMAAIADQGGKCQKGDVFFFYYSGHGANVPDVDGDEADGQDEALCLVTPDGTLDWDAFLTDDDFAVCVTDAVAPGADIIIMTDCCHSGTIGDFENDVWDGHTAISISGCTDAQTSGDTGQGGIETHSLLLAVQEMQDNGTDHYSLAQLYNAIIEKDDSVFDSAQDITINWTDDTSPEDIAWPLIPKTPYTAPWGK